MKSHVSESNNFWFGVKDELKKTWDLLSDEELERFKGDMSAVGKLIQKKYRINHRRYAKKLAIIFRREAGARAQPRFIKRSNKIRTEQ